MEVPLLEVRHWPTVTVGLVLQGLKLVQKSMQVRDRKPTTDTLEIQTLINNWCLDGTGCSFSTYKTRAPARPF